MVFVSQNRMRGGRGRGRGIGEVSFQSGNPERDGGARTDYESRPPAAGELRITVGNDKYRENNSGNNPYGQRQGPGPGYDSHRGRGGQYGRDADMYNAPGRPDSNSRGSYQSQEGYGRDYEREAGDRRGFGASQGPGAPQSQHSYGAASRAGGQSYSGPPPTSSASSTSASAASSRPLKSILKKKNEPAAEPQSNTSQKPSGLPGMSNYLDDIDDEDKFLYGEDNDHKHAAEHVQQKSHRTPGLDIKSAAQAWKPSAPSNTVSGIVSDFVSSQRSYSDRQSYPQTQASSQYSQAPSSASNQAGGGDLWSMLAKSVQTVQSQQPPVQQDIYGNRQQSMYQSTPAQSVQAQVEPPQSAQSSDSGHDPTIENILKSIGFDFDMSKRMQEKAKQAAGEVVPPKPPKTEESQFGINQAASFLGSDMSQDMRSSLGLQDESRDGDRYRRDSASRDYSDRDRRSDRRSEEYDDTRDRRESSDRKRDRDYDDNRGDSHDRKRGRSFDDNSNDAHDRYKSSYDMFSSPAKTTSQSIPARDLSPVSDEGSPPPPMFNLPPITIKRKTGLDRNRSPGWEQRRSPERTIQIKRSSRSPSFTRSISSFGKRSNRSRSNSQDRDVQPRKNSPIIRRTIMISPDFRKKMDKSPLPGKRPSPSPGGRASPGRRSSRSPGRSSKNKSPGRGRSPGKRRSLSPVKRRSPSPKRGRSPGRDRSPRKRSRSPRKRSRSPRRRSKSPRRRSRSPRRRSRSPRKRSRSPRRRSRSPRGTKRSRSPRGSSRDRKMRRSRSGDRFRSPGHGRRSRSGSRGRGRSLSPESVDSDIDGPANKEYFSSPLRMPGRPPRFYNNPPGGPPMPGPPPNFGPPPGPPMMFGQGPPPGPMGAPPPFGMPPPFSVPPPAMAPGPPNYGSQLTYIVPTEPPPVMDPSVPPPGTFNTPHLLPTQPVDLPEVPGEERRQRDDKDTKDTRDNKKDESRRDRSSSHERRIVISKPKTSASKSSSSSDKKDSDKKPVDKAKILKEREDFDKKIKILQSEFENLKKLEEELKANTKMTKENETILEENSKLRDEIKKELTKLDKDKKAFETKHSSILKDVIAKETPSKRQITVTKKTDTTKKSNDRKDTKDDKKDTKSDSQFKVEKGKLMKHQFVDNGGHWCKSCNVDFSNIHDYVQHLPTYKHKQKGKLMKHQFVDNGGHWCKSCNVDFSNIHDYVQHLPTYKHKQSIPTDFRPWKEGFQPNEGMIVNKNGIRVPLPGIEFMYPVTAYYCKLCKVFLGDVSSGVDHFRCESHYINYQAYCKDNPYHEKKLKEDKDAFYKKKSEDKKNEKKDRDSSKLTSSEVREKERQKKQETDSKSRDSRRRSDDDRRSRDGDSRSSSSQKSGGLPPWQSVSQKVEEPSKSSLDSFLTTNTDGGKVPVVVDKKKKVSGQEVLKAFNEKKKLKEQQEREAKEKELEAKLEEERKEREALQLQLEALKNEQELKIQLETKKNKREIEELKNKLAAKDDKLQVEDMEIDEEPPGEIKDLKMMGIDPHSITPLYDIKPPPPRTQNIPHPDQKAHSTVSGADVHNLFFGNKSGDRKKAPKPSPNDLADIPLPGGSPVKKPEGPKKHWKVYFEPVQDEKPKETDNKTDIDEVKEEKSDIDNDKKDVQNDNTKESTGEEEKPVVHIEIEIENDKDSKSDNQVKLEQENESVMKVDEETDRFKCEVKVDIMDDKETASNETDDKDVVEKEEESSVVKVEVEMKDSPASLCNENEMKLDNVEEKVKDDVEIKEKDNSEEKEKDNSVEKEKDNVEMKEEDTVDAKESDVTKDADKESEDISNVKEGTPEDDEVTPRGKRGGRRGRGRGRGKGRGRGARGGSKRSTRATRSNIDTEQLDESIDTTSEPSQEIQDSGNDAEPKVVETENAAPAEEQEISTDIPVSSGTDEKLSEITDNDKETETLNANNTTSENTTQSEVSTGLDDNSVKSNDDNPQTDINTEPENASQEALQSRENEKTDKDPPSVKDESESAPSEGIEMKSDIVQDDKTENIDLDIVKPLPETEAITEPIAKSSPAKPKRGARGRPKKSTAKSKTQDDSDSVTKTIELINELNKQSEDATLSEETINDSKSNDTTKPSETIDNSLTLEVGKSPGKGAKRKTRSNVKPKDTTSEIDIDNQPVLDLNLLDPENPLDTNYSEMIEMEEGPVSFDMPTSSSSLENVNVEINMIGADSSTVEVNVTNENSSVLNVKNKEKEYDVLLSGVNILEDNSSSFDFGSPVKVQRMTSGEDKEKASDNEDNASEHSGISMHISSDFEVVDDIDDLADVLPLS